MINKKIEKLFLIFVIIFTILLAGCNENTNVSNLEQNVNLNENTQSNNVGILKGKEFQLLQQAADEMLKEGKLNEISPDEVYRQIVLEEDLNYFIVDIRSPEHFAAGHIQGAVNIPYALSANQNLIANLPKDKTIVVVCYSGHTASQTASFWKLLGYNAVPMLNGMGGWTLKEGLGVPLPEKTFDFPLDITEISYTTYQLPSVAFEEAANLQELIMKRSQTYLSSGKQAVIKAPEIKEKVLDQKDTNYFLIDIRNQNDFIKGHLPGAINIPFNQIAEVENLKKIPTDKKVILIGYTGNDASQIVRILNLLGYDTYPLMYGMRVWTANESVTGIMPISHEKRNNYPVNILQYDLDGGGGGASCG